MEILSATQETDFPVQSNCVTRSFYFNEKYLHTVGLNQNIAPLSRFEFEQNKYNLK